MTQTIPQSAAYSRLQIRLHWITLGLIIVQVLSANSIIAAWEARLEGVAAGFNPVVLVHVISGISILLLVGWRLALRRRDGVPTPPGGTLARLAVHVGHLALYAALAAMALSGGMAWVLGIEDAAGAHQTIKFLLLVLILGHVVLALYHQIVLRDGTMDRMR